MITHLIPKRAGIRYVLIGVIAFTMGSAGVVVGSSASNAPIFRLGDATDPAAIATVDAAGSLHVSQQGTIGATLTNTDFPDAGTQSRLDTANGKLDTANNKLDATNTKLDTANASLGQLTFDGSGNLKTAPQGTTQVSGSVTVTNLPSVTSGVTEIDLATQTGIASGHAAEWDGVDVTGCRSFAVAVKTNGDGSTPAPSDLHVYTWSNIGQSVDADLHTRDGTHTTGGDSVWGFPTQPGTNEPFFASVIGLYARNGDSVARDMVAAIFCSH